MKTQTKKHFSWGILASLVLSLAGNVWLLSRFGSDQTDVGDEVPPRVTMAEKPRTPQVADRVSAPPVPVAAVSFADSPERLAEVLARTSIPRVVWEEIVRGRINQAVDERKLDLVRKLAATTPWWSQRAARRNPVAALSTNERNELAGLEIEARSMTLALLGPGVFDRYGFQEYRYDFVSLEKAIRLDFLVRDFDNLTRVTRDSMRSVVTAADQRLLKLLQDKRDEELQGLLTAAELSAFHARFSPADRATAEVGPGKK